MTVATFELPEYVFTSDANRDGLAMIEAHEHIEPFFHPILFRNFDQQRGAQLASSRHEGIIHVQLILDFAGIENMLDTNHFLGLKPQRLAIFEDEREQWPKENPAPLLERDDLRAKLLPLAFIVSHG